jgi:hypothetical protein
MTFFAVLPDLKKKKKIRVQEIFSYCSRNYKYFDLCRVQYIQPAANVHCIDHHSKNVDMSITSEIARYFRAVYFGGNWTGVNLKDSLAGVNWEQATTKVDSLNTIAALVFHINYYVGAITNVLKDEPLSASDKYSFDLEPILSQADWEKLLNKTWTDAENFAILIEKIPDDKLWETFANEKYGNYYRNLHGVIEHTHYHLGQIVIIKKLLLQNTVNK